MVVSPEQIIDFIRKNGPSLPSEIKTALNVDLFILGAILSEMVKNKEILMSYGKIGSSSLYYLPGQEEMLKRLYDYLKQPEKDVFKKLESSGILLEKELQPVEILALTKILDFAKKIEIEKDNEKLVFWKWYLLDDETAMKMIEEKTAKKEKKHENLIAIEEKREIETEKPKVQTFGISKLKISKKLELEEFLNDKKITVKDVLMNAQNYSILYCFTEISNIILGIHDKKSISENDVILFAGYCYLHKVSGILLLTCNPKIKILELTKKLSITLYKYSNGKFVKIG
ncbi:MAG: hypothetical protein QW524_03530 [Candidatus Woesearchaeota archaeon]